MKINFGDYTYFGDRNNKYSRQDQYAFNNDLFNNLIANRQYRDAYNYASNYHFNNPEVQRRYENELIELKHQGRITEAIYSRIDSKEKLAKVEFADNVFNNGGIEQLLTHTTNEETKDYVDRFRELKRRIGSSDTDEATSLSVTFQPKKQDLFGIDWLAKDNENNIENFYKTTGLTQTQLEKAGVEIINKDGSTTLKFTKDNPLANNILYGVPMEHPSEKALRIMGKLNPVLMPTLLNEFSNKDVIVKGYNKSGKEIASTDKTIQASSNVGVINFDAGVRNPYDLLRFKSFVNDALINKDETYKKLNLGEREYSTVIGPSITDDLDELNELHDSGQIDDKTYYREWNRRAGWAYDILHGLGSGDIVMYSNNGNKEPTDETLKEMNNDQRADLLNAIRAVDKKRLRLLSGMMDGEIGTMIVIDPLPADKDKEGDEAESMYKGRTTWVFIPGLFQEQAQQRINNDTSISAIREYNDMKNYGYDYETIDGNTISVDEKGNAWINKQKVDKDDVIREINKDMIKERGANQIKYKYLNANDEIIDFEHFELDARRMAVGAANELYPNIPLVNKDGTPFTIDDIFSYKATPDDDELLGRKAVNELQYQMYNKIKDIFDIYQYILQGTSYYYK